MKAIWTWRHFCWSLELGANRYARDEDGCLPLHIAAENGDKDLVRLLLDASSVAQKKFTISTRNPQRRLIYQPPGREGQQHLLRT